MKTTAHHGLQVGRPASTASAREPAGATPAARGLWDGWTGSLVLSCLTTHRRGTRARGRTETETVLAPNVPPKIHASWGPVMRAAMPYITLCIAWLARYSRQTSARQFSLFFPRAPANPSAGAMHAPRSWPCLFSSSSLIARCYADATARTMGACMHVNCILPFDLPCWTLNPGSEETAAGHIYLPTW